MIHYATFDRFEVGLTLEQVQDCSHAGDCDGDVQHWAPEIPRPEECTAEALREELAECGAWDEEELSDDQANWELIVWLSAVNILDDLERGIK